ncbi:succinate dehydrogenase, cytochrome b556 subunit [Salinarchaeum sp. IM2453]|uniref:succinate dehydrogenase, cytochrome b556 subunit n=1 Tax=Salinarchaeum sp. IM2453 TaxID=2862870 RepID=UPI001C82F52C|nr:succinate dehydrogenase, cytochrome b556 subunit [Salinarchaeum sp. IM2453]QZA88901.1 succinate dehydrogenase, cytochrome b556 subunit [Salinarchaeum sp. IM2453]
MSQSYDRGTVEDLSRWKEFSAGMWAWVLHKTTGWVLIGYMFVHIAVLSTAISGPELYNEVLGGLEELFVVKLLELGLVAAVAFHILNGIRLLLLDIGFGAQYQEESFYASLAVTAVSVVITAWVLFGG